MDILKKIGGWFVGFLLFVWAGVKFILDWVGRSTYEDDWGELVSERLPEALSWLFSTPAWVPGILGFALVGFMIWLNWPGSRRTMIAQGDAGTNVPPATEKPKADEPLVIVRDKVFDTESVPLDGYHYISCTFRECTLVFNGGPFLIDNPTWEKGWGIATNDKKISYTFDVLKWLKLLSDKTMVAKIKHEDGTPQPLPAPEEKKPH